MSAYQYEKCPDCVGRGVDGKPGEPKNIYRTSHEAQSVAEHRCRHSKPKVELEAYECEYGNGWHLRKKTY